MNAKMIALGLVATILFWAIASYLISLLPPSIPTAAQAFLVTLLGAALGAYIAKRNFALPAFALLGLYWAYIIYVLYSIAEPTGRASVLGIISNNTSSITLQAFATLIGVIGGQLLGQRSQIKAIAT